VKKIAIIMENALMGYVSVISDTKVKLAPKSSVLINVTPMVIALMTNVIVIKVGLELHVKRQHALMIVLIMVINIFKYRNLH
jgi:hypothetical protein